MVRGPQPGWARRSSRMRGLDLRGHLVRAGLGLRRPVGQAGQAVGRIAAQPVVHGLAHHPVAPGHVDDGGAVEDLAHRLVALLHQSQLHEHGRPPSDLRARTTTAKKVATGGWWTLVRTASVVQVPEPLSPRYRSRVREVSGRYRSHGVQYVPGPHSHRLAMGAVDSRGTNREIGRPGVRRTPSDLQLSGVGEGT